MHTSHKGKNAVSVYLTAIVHSFQEQEKGSWIPFEEQTKAKCSTQKYTITRNQEGSQGTKFTVRMLMVTVALLDVH